AFRNFLEENQLTRRIAEKLEALNTEDVKALAECGATIRQWIVDAPLPAALEAEIRAHYARLAAESGGAISVAGRSSAHAEDLPAACFAGPQQASLSVAGIDATLRRTKAGSVSLHNAQATSAPIH